MLNILNKKIKIHSPNAVLLDTDNTLYDYSPAHSKAMEATSIKFQDMFDISRKEFEKAYIEARVQIKSELGPVASSHSRLLYFQRLLEIIGFKAQLMISLDLEQTYWRTFLANAPLFGGVLNFIESLKEYNIPIAVVTDLTAHIQLRKLTYFNLEEAFDAVVTSEEAGADKPYLRNFTLALNKLGVSKEKNIWVIGDNPKTDIVGGKLIGATTLQKIHNNIRVGEGEAQPDIIFDSFFELIELVKKI